MTTLYSLCQCGCGDPAPVWNRTDTRKGRIKGQPAKYVPGHHNPYAGHVVSGNGCWVWQGKPRRGYSTLYKKVYERTHGPVPSGYQVDHVCQNKLCLNPDHLEAVTPSVNIRRRPATKLTLDAVKTIRYMHANGEASYSRLATLFSVHLQTIAGIIQGKRWREQ